MSNRIGLQELFLPAENRVSDAQNFKSDFCNYKEPALELSKNRFDERISNDAREGLTLYMMHFLRNSCKLNSQFVCNLENNAIRIIRKNLNYHPEKHKKSSMQIQRNFSAIKSAL